MAGILTSLRRTDAGSATLALLLLGALLCPAPAAGESLPDPTRPSSPEVREQERTRTQQEREPSWQLSSVIYSPQRRVAVINGEVKKVGDSVAGAKVTSIRPDSVVLIYRGQQITIGLSSGESGITRNTD